MTGEGIDPDLGILVTTYQRTPAGRWRTTDRRCGSWREAFALIWRYGQAGPVRIDAACGGIFVEVGI